MRKKAHEGVGGDFDGGKLVVFWPIFAVSTWVGCETAAPCHSPCAAELAETDYCIETRPENLRTDKNPNTDERKS